MNKDLLNILSHLSEKNNALLIRYLQGQLNKEEQEQLEVWLQQSGFEKEAFEGLQQIHHKEQLEGILTDLNQSLQQQIRKRNKKRKRKPLQLKWWILLTTVLILFLLAVSYILIHLLYREG